MSSLGPRPIRSKYQTMQLYAQGMFGNNDSICFTLEELKKREIFISNEVVVRYLEPMSPYYGQMPFEQVESWVKDCISHGARRDMFAFHPSMAEDTRVFNAEFMLDPSSSSNGYYLYYSNLPMKMRPALLQGGQHATGLRAWLMVKHYMNEYSFEDFQELLEIYHDHVFEFSSWTTCVGNLPCRNTIVWEVRQY